MGCSVGNSVFIPWHFSTPMTCQFLPPSVLRACSGRKCHGVDRRKLGLFGIARGRGASVPQRVRPRTQNNGRPPLSEGGVQIFNFKRQNAFIFGTTRAGVFGWAMLVGPWIRCDVLSFVCENIQELTNWRGQIYLTNLGHCVGMGPRARGVVTSAKVPQMKETTTYSA